MFSALGVSRLGVSRRVVRQYLNKVGTVLRSVSSHSVHKCVCYPLAGELKPGYLITDQHQLVIAPIAMKPISKTKRISSNGARNRRYLL